MCSVAAKNPEHAIRKVISASCDSLDRRDYKGFLDLCSDTFTYKITAYSPEIRKDMTWLEKDRGGLGELFKMLPVHNRDRRPLARHFAVFDVDYAEDQRTAKVVSGLQVFRTESDGGVTTLAAVGRYLDEVSLEGETVTLISRELRLDTRMLGMGLHEPL